MLGVAYRGDRLMMPKKVRELKRDLRRAGFIEETGRGRGSHVMFFHPRVVDAITVPGKDGDDAPRYLEKQVRQRIEESRS